MSSYNNIDIISGMMLICLCLQFIDTPLCTMCLVLCIQTCNIDVFDGNRSLSYTGHISVTDFNLQRKRRY